MAADSHQCPSCRGSSSRSPSSSSSPSQTKDYVCKSKHRLGLGPRWNSTMLVLLCVLSVLFTCCSALRGQLDSNDIQTFLHTLDSNDGDNVDDSAKDNEIQPLSVMWGIPDTTATVGRIFKYQLPKEAFKGVVSGYKVTEIGKDSLPSWLHFDSTTGTLEGVPGQDDLGKQYHLEVAASGDFGADTVSRAKDVFSVSVTEDNIHADTNGATPLKDVEAEGGDDLKPIKCPSGSSVTMATVIVDADVSEMGAEDRIGLMSGMCGHLKMPVDLLRLMPLGNRPMFDSSALVAGPGDVKQPKSAGAILQWEVGCGNVHAPHMPILQQLEWTSNDGSMGKAVGHGIVGWHVTNNKPPAPRRMKRYVYPTPTPQPGWGPPTRRPVPTHTIGEEDRPTHYVPTAVSPTYEVKPTRTRHKDRTKTKGRHPHKTRTKDRTRTRTPRPTATMGPIVPTRATDWEATRPTDDRWPPYETSSPGVSRTDDFLEPSIHPSRPGRPGGPTDELPTRTYEFPDYETKEPIWPSKTKQYPGATDGDEAFQYAPILKKDIRRIKVRVGDILQFQIPQDTFYDVEDGDTHNLKLVFMTMDGLSVPRNSWVQFNQTSQTLYGLPMPEHEGPQQYLMAAIDSDGKIARDAFEIVVTRRPRDRKINHEFSVTLDLEYQQFMVDVNKRIDVANKIAGAYGDKDMSKMTVTKIAPGSVEYAWTNNSVPTDPCPVAEINKLLRYLVTPNNTINQTFVEAMKPYRIMKAGAQPHGACEDENDGIKPVDSSEGPTSVESKPRETSDDDILVTTVVPAVVIAAMLLLAGCIACILYRKKRKGKLSDEDQHTFINKGIPIIFSDELEEKADPPTKPLIMEEEKPPLPPPGYQRSMTGSMASTPTSDHKEPLLDTEYDDDDDDQNSPPYRPPPPVTGSQNNRQPRPHAQQPPFRHPPPYVPP